MAAFASPSSAKAPSRKRAARSSSSAPAPLPEFSHEEIATRAFEKFMARRCEHGFHDQDWIDAEEELIAEYRDRQ